MKPARTQITLRLTRHDKRDWAHLNYFGHTHLICGESIKEKNAQYSFVGGHRVRLWQVKNNVHWVVPSDDERDGDEIDISDVKPQAAPRRQGGK